MSLTSQNPGTLDCRVQVCLREVGRGSAGGTVSNVEYTDKTFAAWFPQFGREMMVALSRRSESVGFFRLRYRTDLDEKMLIRKGSETFEVSAPPVELGRRQYIDVPVRRSHRSEPTESIDVSVTELATSSLHTLVHSTLPTYF